MARRQLSLRFLPVLVLLAALAGWTADAAAQCSPREEGERARMMIERAREVVEQSAVPEARELLLAAVARLKEAAAAADRGEIERACILARVSQSLTVKAVEVARRGTRGLEELEQMLQKTDEFLHEAADIVRQSGVEDARKLMGAALSQQKEAWGAFRSRRRAVALKLTLMARETAGRALRRAEGLHGGAALVERELQRTDGFLEEARSVLERSDNGESGRRLLANAVRMQAQARLQFRRGHPGVALGLTRQARMMATRALGRTDRTPEAGDVGAMIATTAELVERLEEAAAEAGHKRALRLLSRAGDLLDDARSDLAESRPREALGAARAASALALDAAEMLERSGGE